MVAVAKPLLYPERSCRLNISSYLETVNQILILNLLRVRVLTFSGCYLIHISETALPG